MFLIVDAFLDREELDSLTEEKNMATIENVTEPVSTPGFCISPMNPTVGRWFDDIRQYIAEEYSIIHVTDDYHSVLCD